MIDGARDLLEQEEVPRLQGEKIRMLDQHEGSADKDAVFTRDFARDGAILRGLLRAGTKASINNCPRPFRRSFRVNKSYWWVAWRGMSVVAPYICALVSFFFILYVVKPFLELNSFFWGEPNSYGSEQALLGVTGSMCTAYVYACILSPNCCCWIWCCEEQLVSVVESQIYCCFSNRVVPRMYQKPLFQDEDAKWHSWCEKLLLCWRCENDPASSSLKKVILLICDLWFPKCVCRYVCIEIPRSPNPNVRFAFQFDFDVGPFYFCLSSIVFEFNTWFVVSGSAIIAQLDLALNRVHAARSSRIYPICTRILAISLRLGVGLVICRETSWLPNTIVTNILT